MEASALHARNIERYLIGILPAEEVATFSDAIKILSKNASQELPTMP